MSTDICRVEFASGLVLYSRGDSSVIVLDRLYETPEEASAAYRHEEPVHDDELRKATAEPVLCSTRYGSGQWSEMLTQNAMACPRTRLLVVHPHHIERYNDWGIKWASED